MVESVLWTLLGSETMALVLSRINSDTEQIFHPPCAIQRSKMITHMPVRGQILQRFSELLHMSKAESSLQICISEFTPLTS